LHRFHITARGPRRSAIAGASTKKKKHKKVAAGNKQK